MRTCSRETLTIGLAMIAVASLLAVPGAHAAGRVLWTLQLDDYTPTQFVTVAPTGTIYATGGEAIYAVTAGGQVQWISPAAPADGVAHSISLGVDGTIYTGMGLVGNDYSLVVALNPDGSVRWQFVPPVFGSLVTGPNVGPDGNIYAVQSHEPDDGLGAFSLDPAGELRWANVGNLPPLLPADTFATTSDIEFGADRLHTGWIAVGHLNPTLHTFSLDGAALWSTLGVSPHTTSLPVVDPADRVLCTWGQTGMRAFSPDGQQEWFALHPNGASLVERPAVDSKGVIYTGDFVGVELWALNPDGTTRWVQPPQDAFMSNIAVSPDGQTLVVSGQDFNAAEHWIRGYDAADGGLLWQVDLPPENGMPQFASAYETAFSPNSQVAYFTTQFAGSVNDYGYLYAIDVSDRAVPPSCDINGDGTVNIDDLLAVIAAWGPCRAPPALCPADIVVDGQVNIDDLLLVISSWG